MQYLAVRKSRDLNTQREAANALMEAERLRGLVSSTQPVESESAEPSAPPMFEPMLEEKTTSLDEVDTLRGELESLRATVCEISGEKEELMETLAIARSERDLLTVEVKTLQDKAERHKEELMLERTKLKESEHDEALLKAQDLLCRSELEVKSHRTVL